MTFLCLYEIENFIVFHHTAKNKIETAKHPAERAGLPALFLKYTDKMFLINKISVRKMYSIE
ncbi:MAG: hypothetical protein ACFWTN_09680 [Clostridium sp.]|jgi:hypothetical protein